MSDKPLDICPEGSTPELMMEIERLRAEVRRLSELVSTDPLTNLFNYRHFSRTLDQEIERSQRTLQPTSLIMVDADYFKKVNDEWGHETGNIALQSIASCIIQNVRKLDIACRYGGEEFAIILPSSELSTSIHVAERIRTSIEETPLDIALPNGEIQQLHLTASAGLAVYSGKTPMSAKQLVEAADAKLYQAKKQGRNRICFPCNEENNLQVSAEEKSELYALFKNDG